ncbi:hypothetical protein [Chamaesiphon sp. VAR_69_metabat_338]|uniref:hypothetical protein n=1 Tax=Chamaesiphon sp. VAR_69_metabat_338 TaxID=2964704 RepID=UPI00286E0EFA|nr:hypothetical protein [Chamaesiphon sp. VAR_69_metabat_338]
MIDPNLSFLVSATSMFISGTTAWLTLFRQGKLKMTKPTIVCFGITVEDRKVIPKIFLRTLLYSTAKRGIVVENMFVNLSQNGLNQTFSIWAYRDKELVRGSGIYISMEGTAYEHQFTPLPDSNEFKFLAGNSVLKVFGLTVGNKNPFLMTEIHLHLTEEQVSAIIDRKAFIWFDWNPILQSYSPQILTGRS